MIYYTTISCDRIRFIVRHLYPTKNVVAILRTFMPFELINNIVFASIGKSRLLVFSMSKKC